MRWVWASACATCVLSGTEAMPWVDKDGSELKDAVVLARFVIRSSTATVELAALGRLPKSILLERLNQSLHLPNQIDWAFRALKILSYNGMDLDELRELLPLMVKIAEPAIADEVFQQLHASPPKHPSHLERAVTTLNPDFSIAESEDEAIDLESMGLRLVQLLEVLANLSTNEDHLAHPNCKHAVTLSQGIGHSKDLQLRRLGPEGTVLKQWLLQIILTSDHLNLLYAALVIMSHLVPVSSNQNWLRSLGSDLWSRLAQMVLIHDVKVLCATLELYYQFTLHDDFAAHLAAQRHVVPALISHLRFLPDSWPDRLETPLLLIEEILKGTQPVDLESMAPEVGGIKYLEPASATPLQPILALPQSLQHLKTWLTATFAYKGDHATALRRAEMYRSYVAVCQNENRVPLCTEVFGKLIMECFPGTKCVTGPDLGRTIYYTALSSKASQPTPSPRELVVVRTPKMMREQRLEVARRGPLQIDSVRLARERREEQRRQAMARLEAASSDMGSTPEGAGSHAVPLAAPAHGSPSSDVVPQAKRAHIETAPQPSSVTTVPPSSTSSTASANFSAPPPAFSSTAPVGQPVSTAPVAQPTSTAPVAQPTSTALVTQPASTVPGGQVATMAAMSQPASTAQPASTSSMSTSDLPQVDGPCGLAYEDTLPQVDGPNDEPVVLRRGPAITCINPQCDKVYKTVSSLSYHLTSNPDCLRFTHTYTLDSIPDTTSADHSFIKNLLTNASQPGYVWVCRWDLCHRPFKTFREAMAHVADFHATPTRPAPVTCHWEGCTKLAPTMKRSLLSAHMHTHYNVWKLTREDDPSIDHQPLPPEDPTFNFSQSIDTHSPPAGPGYTSSAAALPAMHSASSSLLSSAMPTSGAGGLPVELSASVPWAHQMELLNSQEETLRRQLQDLVQQGASQHPHLMQRQQSVQHQLQRLMLERQKLQLQQGQAALLERQRRQQMQAQENQLRHGAQMRDVDRQRLYWEQQRQRQFDSGKQRVKWEQERQLREQARRKALEEQQRKLAAQAQARKARQMQQQTAYHRAPTVTAAMARSLQDYEQQKKLFLENIRVHSGSVWVREHACDPRTIQTIRFMAALVLRNLAKTAPTAQLKCREDTLLDVATENAELRRPLLQCIRSLYNAA
ncbi:uncharacterized protein MONBRDRAFT_27505 [Monosiga brevicollis MX1]|uniref:RFX-type winged-helix domain-containing protein n=1 Tax=Monosiga brevicollis TaxID=81824 RepID=A9V5G7_MONBE|nr:uncharacterized protein MONBRDRAFT_27505 [Monosiga brevicollis MX1]EDQ87280.1 predicted protein [Monosiga brevicollis MX1]|eukprot:XP_001747893.1 hypothetical protein [Monosiga brevicollis MX1]